MQKKGKGMISNKQGFLMLSNDFAECKISVFGANVVSYRPLTENKDVFWLGELNKFDGVGAIRGGIPICWPRFAEEELNSNLPRHGFARLSNWVVKDFFEDETSVGVKLSLIPDAKYGVGIRADYTVRITDKLECVLETFNDGPDDFCFSEALHAYFYVGARDEAIIKGMVGNTYKNALDRKYYKLEKDLVIDEEFDAAFVNHTGEIAIVDKVLKRIITVTKGGSLSTVVWNPDKDLAEMSVGQYKNFVCVEPANQGEMFVTVPAGQKHVLTMIVDVKKIDDNKV